MCGKINTGLIMGSCVVHLLVSQGPWGVELWCMPMLAGSCFRGPEVELKMSYAITGIMFLEAEISLINYVGYLKLTLT